MSRCCNAIFGPGGNSHCPSAHKVPLTASRCPSQLCVCFSPRMLSLGWDGQQFTFETCCGEPYHATDCSAFVTHFSFGVVSAVGEPKLAGEIWETCARAMDLDPARLGAQHAPTSDLIQVEYGQFSASF